MLKKQKRKMVEIDGSPGKRSRGRYRRVQKRTPSGRTRTHYVERRPNAASCARCHMALRGLPRQRPAKLGSLPKNQRRVSRRFGGMLCHKCLIHLEKYETRMETGFPVKRDLTIERFLPQGWYNTLEKKFDKELKVEVEEIEAEEYSHTKSPAMAKEVVAKAREVVAKKAKEKAAKAKEAAPKGIEGLKGVGPKSLEVLKKAKITKRSDLSKADLKELAKKTKIPEAKLKKWKEEAAKIE